jgi:ABC-type phosphate transport system ATPase subunit
MKIIARQKLDSSVSVNTCSYSGPRGSRKSSILNMLTRLFSHEEGTRDLGKWKPQFQNVLVKNLNQVKTRFVSV